MPAVSVRMIRKKIKVGRERRVITYCMLFFFLVLIGQPSTMGTSDHRQMPPKENTFSAFSKSYPNFVNRFIGSQLDINTALFSVTSFFGGLNLIPCSYFAAAEGISEASELLSSEFHDNRIKDSPPSCGILWSNFPQWWEFSRYWSTVLPTFDSGMDGKPSYRSALDLMRQRYPERSAFYHCPARAEPMIQSLSVSSFGNETKHNVHKHNRLIEDQSASRNQSANAEGASSHQALLDILLDASRWWIWKEQQKHLPFRQYGPPSSKHFEGAHKYKKKEVALSFACGIETRALVHDIENYIRLGKGMGMTPVQYMEALDKVNKLTHGNESLWIARAEEEANETKESLLSPLSNTGTSYFWKSKSLSNYSSELEKLQRQSFDVFESTMHYLLENKFMKDDPALRHVFLLWLSESRTKHSEILSIRRQRFPWLFLTAKNLEQATQRRSALEQHLVMRDLTLIESNHLNFIHNNLKYTCVSPDHKTGELCHCDCASFLKHQTKVEVPEESSPWRVDLSNMFSLAAAPRNAHEAIERIMSFVEKLWREVEERVADDPNAKSIEIPFVQVEFFVGKPFLRPRKEEVIRWTEYYESLTGANVSNNTKISLTDLKNWQPLKKFDNVTLEKDCWWVFFAATEDCSRATQLYNTTNHEASQVPEHYCRATCPAEETIRTTEIITSHAFRSEPPEISRRWRSWEKSMSLFYRSFFQADPFAPEHPAFSPIFVPTSVVFLHNEKEEEMHAGALHSNSKCSTCPVFSSSMDLLPSLITDVCSQNSAAQRKTGLFIFFRVQLPLAHVRVLPQIRIYSRDHYPHPNLFPVTRSYEEDNSLVSTAAINPFPLAVFRKTSPDQKKIYLQELQLYKYEESKVHTLNLLRHDETLSVHNVLVAILKDLDYIENVLIVGLSNAQVELANGYKQLFEKLKKEEREKSDSAISGNQETYDKKDKKPASANKISRPPPFQLVGAEAFLKTSVTAYEKRYYRSENQLTLTQIHQLHETTDKVEEKSGIVHRMIQSINKWVHPFSFYITLLLGTILLTSSTV